MHRKLSIQKCIGNWPTKWSLEFSALFSLVFPTFGFNPADPPPPPSDSTSSPWSSGAQSPTKPRSGSSGSIFKPSQRNLPSCGPVKRERAAAAQTGRDKRSGIDCQAEQATDADQAQTMRAARAAFHWKQRCHTGTKGIRSARLVINYPVDWITHISLNSDFNFVLLVIQMFFLLF